MPLSLIIELVVIVGAPVLLIHVPLQPVRFGSLFVLAAYCLWRLWRAGVLADFVHFNWPACRRALPVILLRVAAAWLAIAGLVMWLYPERLFYIPRTDPGLMVVILFGYSFVSVLPQEIAFRAYAAWRMDRAGLGFWAALVVSSVLFGWVHIVFGAWLSVLLSTLAGLSFYHNYRSTGSLAAVWVEHSLVGIGIFALGLDQLFYRGAAP